ncbi:MAG: sensor domain-containing diguanylate cyclase [Polyangiaceae bacterium]|nr:sensor domain-containing diguanylate cyclase [Polyangiaceae bacterium]MCB9605932.1 sensor domain-containing diguanylate cyclase [Polyangiaceae bacterium]
MTREVEGREPPELDVLRHRVAALETENLALYRAIRLLHQVSSLVRDALELEPTCYALLTGVTAGVGLGFNRAMLFITPDASERGRACLSAIAAVGPTDEREADLVWREIESLAPDLRALYQAGLDQAKAPGSLGRRVRELEVQVDANNPIGLAVRRQALVRGEGDDDLNGLLDLETAVSVPLFDRHGLCGVLYADNRFTGRRADAITIEVLGMLADQAGLALENARRFERLAREARTDALTGLGHHGAMMAALQRAMAESQERSEPLSLAMIDLDDFKRVNDTHGHLAGDALLMAVAERLRDVTRGRELAFRYGGEEFAVLLPGAQRHVLQKVGERLRKSVGARPFSVSEKTTLRVTCSVGIAEQSPGDNAEALIDRADQALLEAKSSGKNCVRLASAPTTR